MAVEPITRFLLAVGAILLVSHFCGEVLRRIGQPPVLGERVAVGHAGDEIAHIADIVLRRRLLPPFRRQRLKVVAIAREEIGDDALGALHDALDPGMAVDAGGEKGSQDVEVFGH